MTQGNVLLRRDVPFLTFYPYIVEEIFKNIYFNYDRKNNPCAVWHGDFIYEGGKNLCEETKQE